MNHEAKEGKTMAILGYFTFIGALIAITMNLEPKNGFARFHIRQAFGLHLVFHLVAIALTYLGLGSLSLVWMGLGFLIWLYGLIGAVQLKKTAYPVLGPYFQKWFTFIQ